jgi:putative protein-disulfide isomerase
MTPTLYYCYDAYCGWCYGFSPVIKQLDAEYSNRIAFEVLSGGMIITETPRHIGVTAAYIQGAYKQVEDYTGIKFGQDYLWHIFNPDKSDWFPSSEKPAIALCVLKEQYPDKQVAFAAALQHALHFEGRDLCDDEAYRHLLPQFGLEADDFYSQLHSPEMKEKAYYEFALCKQLQVTGYPAVLLQTADTKFYLLARGYTPYEQLKQNLEHVLNQTGNPAE